MEEGEGSVSVAARDQNFSPRNPKTLYLYGETLGRLGVEVVRRHRTWRGTLTLGRQQQWRHTPALRRQQGWCHSLAVRRQVRDDSRTLENFGAPKFC